MGRQAYLSRLALGRSAFERPVNEHEHALERSIRSNDHGADGNYTEECRLPQTAVGLSGARIYRHDGQLFDELGHPINPASREFSRSMRRAQNEVLSIVGVCVRDIPKPHGTQAAPKFEPDVELIQRTAQENLYGLILRLVGAAMQCSVMWWIESFRLRLLIFEVPEYVGLAEIIAIQMRSMTVPDFLAGTVSQFTPLLFNEGRLLAREVIGAIDKNIITRRNLAFTNRARLHQMAPTFEIMLTLLINIAIFPLVLQYYLLSLQLVPYTAISPPFASFLPFSYSSPLQLRKIPTNAGLRSVKGWLVLIITNPFVLLTGYRYLEGLAMDFFADHIQAEVMAPSPPDRYSVLCDGVVGLVDRLEKDINIRGENLDIWSGKFISRILRLLGWSWLNHKAYIRNGGSTIPNEAAQAEPSRQERVTRDSLILSGRPVNSHPAALGIATRETNIFESALVNSSSAEDNDTPRDIVVASRSGVLRRDSLQSNSFVAQLHRRTALSEAPTASLVSLINEHLTSLLLLPVKAAVLKHTFSTLINFTLTGSVNGMSLVNMRPSPPFRGNLIKPLNIIKLTEFGFYIQRLALASGLKLVADLGLWTIEWAVVTWAGKKLFDWGNL